MASWEKNIQTSQILLKKKLFYLAPPSVKNGESTSQSKLLFYFIHSSFVRSVNTSSFLVVCQDSVMVLGLSKG